MTRATVAHSSQWGGGQKCCCKHATTECNLQRIPARPSHWMEGSTRNSALSSYLCKGGRAVEHARFSQPTLLTSQGTKGCRSIPAVATCLLCSLAECALLVGVVVHHHPAQPLLGQLALPDLLLDAARGQKAVDEDLHLHGQVLCRQQSQHSNQQSCPDRQRQHNNMHVLLALPPLQVRHARRKAGCASCCGAFVPHDLPLLTSFFWPSRHTRPMACRSSAGFQLPGNRQFGRSVNDQRGRSAYCGAGSVAKSNLNAPASRAAAQLLGQDAQGGWQTWGPAG